MKKNILLTSFCFLYFFLRGQDCSSIGTNVHARFNEVNAQINTLGTNFTQYTSAGYSVPYKFGSIESPKHTIGATSIWIGGKDVSGELRIAASTYLEPGGVGDYVSGPIPASGMLSPNFCDEWSKIWVVSSIDINSHIAIFKAYGVDDYPPESLLNWPAKGNPFFKAQNGFDLPDRPEGYAPFYDANNDGIYNPVKGDYPALNNNGCFIPDYMAWCVFNDVGGKHIHTKSVKPVNVEIQQTIWGFRAEDTVVNRSLFASYKIIYKGIQALDSAYVGIWTEFELGCPDDDFHGCDAPNNTYYGYNSDKLKDPSCRGSGGYGDNPPVQAVTLLNKPLNKFNYYYIGRPTNMPTGMHDPVNANEFYNYLTGRWKDGSTLKKGGNGYSPTAGTTTDFAFPDEPNNASGWSMVSANMSKTFFEEAVVGSTNLGKLMPGQIVNLDVAYTYHRKTGLDGWQNVSQMKTEVANIKNIYNTGFSNYQKCVKVSTKDLSTAALKIFPNPTNGHLQIDSENELIESIKIFDILGKVVFSQKVNSLKMVVDLDLNIFSKGTYQIICTLESGIVNRRISITN